MTIEDPDFGHLTWSDKLCAWQGNANMPDGASVELLIVTPAWSQPRIVAERNPDRTITPETRNAFRMLLGMTDKLKQKTAADLLSPYNDTWNTEAKPPLSSAEFIGLLQFESATLNPDGTSSVYLTAAGLFTDHAIRIPVNADGSMPHGAMLEG